MKAVGFNRYGGPEVLETIQVDDPKPGQNDVIIRMECTSMNRFDILVREGYHGLPLPMPHVPGIDVVGTVESTGTAVEGINPGERVIANTLFGCGNCKECLANNEVLCNQWKIIGLNLWGSYGELVRVPSSVIMKPPHGYSIMELAAMPLALSVSWKALHSVAKAEQGETVAIRGASGNTGLFSIMLAKALKLNVIALSRSGEKADPLKKLGADSVVDSEKPADEVRRDVLALTEGKGADIVLEPFGSTLNESLGLARQGGRIVSYGALTGTDSQTSVKTLYLRSLKVFGFHNANMADFKEAFAFAAENKIHPVIAKTMKLEEAKEAHRLLQEAKTFGKILLEHE